MKKYLYAGLLSACLAAPAFAGSNNFVPQTPEEPLHRRTVLLCMGVVVLLQAYKYRPRIQRRNPPQPQYD